jgi:hypothetical protein
MSFIGDIFGGGDEVTTVEQTQTTTPPAYALPHLTRILGEAENLFGQPRSFFPGKTYTDFSAPSLAALGAGEGRAVAGSPLIPQAQGAVSGALGFTNPANEFLTSTARGDFLNAGNPFLEAALQPAIDRVQGQFSRAGRLGSGANIGALTQALAPVYAADYDRERSRQIQAQQFLGGLSNQDQRTRLAAAAMAPTAAAADYDDIGRLAQFGAIREAKGGEALRGQMARFDFLQNEPARRLAEYAALTRGGTIGGDVASQTPYFSNPTQQGIGNIANIAGIASFAADEGLFKWLGGL